MSYSIIDILPPKAIIGIDNTRATFDINLKKPLAPKEIIKGLSNDSAAIIGLYCGALYDIEKSQRPNHIDSIFLECSNLNMESIGMSSVTFKKDSGEIISLNTRNCLNNLHLIESLSSIQAHYLGFLIGLGLNVDQIKYSQKNKPYLIIQ